MDWVENIAQNPRLVEAKKVFVACSGGLDSVVLAHFLHQNKFPIALVHVNYQLRGTDSMEDERFVENLAHQLKCPFHLKRIDLYQKLETAGGNLQESARQIRYAFFDELLNQNEAAILCTAHHLNDQLETFLMRLMRKSGVSGLAGIPKERGQIFRPFLERTKQDLLDYAKTHKITWREDASNQKNNYLRNLLRNEWIPSIPESETETEMSLTEAVSILTKAFQQTKRALNEKVQPMLDAFQKSNQLPISDFLSLSDTEQHAFLDGMSWKHSLLKPILSLQNKERSKKVSLGDGHFLYRENDYLVLDGQQQVPIPGLITEEIPSLPSSFDKNFIFLDHSKIKGKLRLRRWSQGDRIEPIGMKGSQLVSDILKDAKVPLYAKKKCFIVEDETSILWVVGHKVGRRKIANHRSKKIIKVSLSTIQ